MINAPFTRPVKSNHSVDGRRFQITIRSNTRVYLLKNNNTKKAGLPDFKDAQPYNNIQEVLDLESGEEQVAIGKCYLHRS